MLKKILLIIVLSIFISCYKNHNVKEINIYLNQVGYLPSEEKYFLVDTDVKAFSIVDKNGEALFKRKITPFFKKDKATGLNLYIGDFTDFKNEGEFYIELEGGLTSTDFKIAKNIFNNLRNQSIKSYYYQRSGIDLEEEFAGIFKRPAGHTEDVSFHLSSPLNGKKEVIGGWYDSGEFGRYTISGAVSLGIMLMAYEQFPEKFQFDNNNIPESNNGVSDFLDEIRFELEWLLKIQNLEEGEFFGALPYMVNSRNYEWCMPHKSSKEMFVYDFSSIATADFTAIMALSSRIFKDIDPDFSNRCLKAAINSWNFISNRGTYPLNGFKRPIDTFTAGYTDYDHSSLIDSDDKLWASIELYLTTGEEEYSEFFKKLYRTDKPDCWHMDWWCTNGFSMLQYVLNIEEDLDFNLKETIKGDFLDYCNFMAEHIDRDGFKVSMYKEEYYWASNATVLRNALQLIFGYKLSHEKKYYNAALSQLNYILGLNVNQKSYVAGFGVDYPKNIHNSILANDGIDSAYPGLMVNGPNSTDNSDNTLPRFFQEGTPPAFYYIDNVDSWASNQNGILFNAPLVAVSAFFSSN